MIKTLLNATSIFMTTLENIVGKTNDALYGYILIILLIAAGLFFTFRTKFAQFRLLPQQFRSLIEKPKGKKGISSFQALMVSTASRVGTGNIIGVSTAICSGGFGAVFWMWVIAIIGAGSAFIESTLAQVYKKRGKDGFYGGPSYYIESALKSRPLAVIFSIFLIVTYGIGFNMLASYNLQSTFEVYSFYNASVTPWIIGGVVALLVLFCLMGGGKGIAKVTGVLVPVMGVAYIAVALIITLINAPALPSIFGRIFTEAFDLRAIFGGFAGSCVMFGIKRGLFSNEAGVGSAPNASATAEVSHPVKQGLVQVLSVFIDTLLVCSATAFMCMASGIEPSKEIAGAQYVQASVSSVLGDFGPIFITVAMLLFAFTTLIGNLYYVDQCVVHLIKREPPKALKIVLYVFWSIIILIGAGLSADLLWNIADVTMGAMTVINIPVILILHTDAIKVLRDFDRQRKAGKDPVFHANSVKLKGEPECWE